MGVGYDLVNYTRQERITFTRVGATTALELASHAAAASITTWYLLTHLGDEISFVSDSNRDWPFDGSKDDMGSYPDVTDEVIDVLIAKQILVDHGKDIFDEDEPDIYIRRLELYRPGT